MSDKSNGIKDRLKRGGLIKRADDGRQPVEKLDPDEVVEKAMHKLVSVVVEQPVCDMFLMEDEQNPMIINLSPPKAEPSDRRPVVLGDMDDNERDELITSIEGKAVRLEEAVWRSIEWQLAWVMATNNLNERVAGVMDNPEDDSPAAEESAGRRLINSIPMDSLNTSRFKRLLYDALEVITLELFAKESGINEDVIRRMLEEKVRNEPKTES